MVPLTHYLALSFLLFVLGVVGVLVRRNLLTVLMSIELMLNAVNLNLVAFSRQLGDLARPGLRRLHHRGGGGGGGDRPRDHHLALPAQGLRQPRRRGRDEGMKA